MPGKPQRRGEAGYNLVILIIAVTVLNIMLAASLPLWSTAIQREKEEELIFRGLQYAEAIRLFQLRFQRVPNRLEELIEIEPRCIRQLWKDPMTDDGKWRLIFMGQDQGLPVQAQIPGPDGKPIPGGLEGDQETDGGDGLEGDGEDDSNFGPRKGEEVAVGPIRGVQSKSGKKSILIFNGRERYDEWQFTVEMLSQGGMPFTGGGVGPGTQVGLPNLSTRWIGRPWPASLGIPQGGMPGGFNPGFNPDRPRGGRPRPGVRPPTPPTGQGIAPQGGVPD